MKYKGLFLCLVMILIISGCTTKSGDDNNDRTIEETIEAGFFDCAANGGELDSYFNCVTDDGKTYAPDLEVRVTMIQQASATNEIIDGRYQNIENSEELGVLWNTLRENDLPTPRPTPPEIDFSSTRIVAISDVAPTGGYELSPLDVTLVDGQLRLVMLKRIPGDNCSTASIITYPTSILTIGNVDKDLNVTFIEAETDCS